MKLFIEIVDGKPAAHPALEENILSAFPEGIPSNFEEFEKTKTPLRPAFYQKTTVEYAKNETGVWTDVWSLVDMTEEEKTAKNNSVISEANKGKDFRIKICQGSLVECLKQNDLIGAEVWQKCIDDHNSWTIQSLDPIGPDFPKYPSKNTVTGEWGFNTGPTLNFFASFK
jgi:hypothetical protein